MKCGVNSSLLTYFWLLQVCGTLDYYLITIQNSQRGWYTNSLFFCDFPRNNTPCTGPHHIHLYTVPFL